MSHVSPGAIQIAKAVAPRLQEVFDTYMIVGIVTDPQTGEETRQILCDTSCKDEQKLDQMQKAVRLAAVWATKQI